MVTFLLLVSALLSIICALFARKKKKFPDAFISLLTTLIAALLALATYLYGVNASDEGARDRLKRLLAVELEETRKAVGPNAAQWRKISATGEPSNNVSYTFVPKVIAADVLKSGLFTEDEALLLQYLLAIENYNKVIESSIGSFSLGTIPGGANVGLVGRVVLSAADPVNTRADELLAKFKNENRN